MSDRTFNTVILCCGGFLAQPVCIVAFAFCSLCVTYSEQARSEPVGAATAAVTEQVASSSQFAGSDALARATRLPTNLRLFTTGVQRTSDRRASELQASHKENHAAGLWLAGPDSDNSPTLNSNVAQQSVTKTTKVNRTPAKQHDTLIQVIFHSEATVRSTQSGTVNTNAASDEPAGEPQQSQAVSPSRWRFNGFVVDKKQSHVWLNTEIVKTGQVSLDGLGLCHLQLVEKRLEVQCNEGIAREFSVGATIY